MWRGKSAGWDPGWLSRKAFRPLGQAHPLARKDPSLPRTEHVVLLVRWFLVKKVQNVLTSHGRRIMSDKMMPF